MAEAAGVSRPLVYRYFPGGKQQLYEAALRSAAEELRAVLREPPEGPLTDRLSRALDRYSRSSTSTTPGSARCSRAAAWSRPPGPVP